MKNRAQFAGVPQIPEEVQLLFGLGCDNPNPEMEAIADAAIAAGMKELRARHLADKNRDDRPARELPLPLARPRASSARLGDYAAFAEELE